MKQFIAILIIFALARQANATIITAQVNNGKWSVSSSWNPSRQPANGDTILIPAGLNLRVDGNEDLDNVVVLVRGTLSFTNGKLRLNALSKVIVDFGGTITGNGNNDQISIAGVFKYRGTDPPVIGYATADVTTGNGFTPYGVLPFRFVSFTASAITNGIYLSWTYNSSPDTRYFEIQSSIDGKDWKTRSRSVAQNTGIELQQYNSTLTGIEKGTTHFRIVQVDHIGAKLYSEVRTITDKNTQSASTVGARDLKAYVTGNQVAVNYTHTSSGPVVIRLLNANGQVISQQKYPASQSRLLLSVRGNIQGIYIIQVIGADNNTDSIRLML